MTLNKRIGSLFTYPIYIDLHTLTKQINVYKNFKFSVSSMQRYLPTLFKLYSIQSILHLKYLTMTSQDDIETNNI